MADININNALKELNDEKNRLWAQFRSKRPDHLLETKHEDFEWKFEEAINDWCENGQDEFNELVAKHVGLKNKNFENMRVRTYYWSKTHKCKCSEKLRPCCHTCHNGKIYFEEDLDNYYGIELYQYDLMIGGPNHGNLIVNGGHPDNENEDDIVYKLVTDNDNAIHIETLKSFAYHHFDYFEDLELKYQEDLDNFQIFIDNFYANGIKNIYTILRDNYISMIGYSKKKRHLHNVLLDTSDRLILQIEERLQTNINNKYRNTLISIREHIAEIKKYMENVNQNILNCVHQLQEQNNTSHVGSKILSYL